MPAPADTLTAHRPERGRRSRPVVLCQGGCGTTTSSCCCCCLHTVGGIVFSALKSGAAATEPDSDFDIRKPDRSAGAVYWTVFGIMAFLCLVAGPAGWLFGALLGPLIQLVASIVAMFVILANEGWGSPRIRSLQRITWAGIFGCLAGIGAMAVLALLLMVR
ncbi:MAG: hypothetical protein K2W96_11260 [Gemmataceae bacterium]|nr:hypothetical protein [Gemmataceae bacterium]